MQETKRKNISSGESWEETVGYSRVVRIGNIVEVSGTTAVEKGVIIGNNAYEQTKYALGKIEKYLFEVGVKMEQVIRTRIYVTDISTWEEVGKAHGERFRDIRPATSMVEVSALIDPKMLVEIEASAIAEE
jgi:enamine deaminase RidA (YjgF/YER057c/UK114 family)